MIRLEEIGFYTLSETRAKHASYKSPLWRGELVLTSRCNFACPYCRHVGGDDMAYVDAAKVVKLLANDSLKNIRFSGGEPTLYRGLYDLVCLAKEVGISRVALSTNGSAERDIYEQLLIKGVDDFSISLDACCAEDVEKMTGGVKHAFDIVSKNIEWLAKRAYTTVGVVLTEDNANELAKIIDYASSLGVADIRIIPAAQCGQYIQETSINLNLDKYPILKYRVANIKNGRSVRGLSCYDTGKCGLVLDDIAVNHNKHYPCIIYMREGGNPIGDVGGNIREERLKWYSQHNSHRDPICNKNCLDVCIDYNNVFAKQNVAMSGK